MVWALAPDEAGDKLISFGAAWPRFFSLRVDMSEQDQAEVRLEFARLKQEHADLDAAIEAMIATACDPLQIQRMKKKKLMLKDKLRIMESQVIPDIIA